MTDAALKAALEAATWAMQSAKDANGCVPPGPEDRAAAAIAAFLRALPHGGRVPDAENPEDPGWSWEAWIGRDLAAAVEQAAREGGGWASTT